MTVEEIEQRIKDSSLPAIQLASAESRNGKSKLGGVPCVPPGFEWPTWNGRPLAFIAQIDLAAMPRLAQLDDLPSVGLLYFFYDQEQATWGFDPNDIGSWRVIYTPDVEQIRIAEPPQGLPKECIYEEKAIAPRLVTSYPSLERLGFDFRSIPDAAFDITDDLCAQSFGDGPQHQIGGFPNAIQGDEMELESQLVSNGLYCGDSSGYQDPRAKELAAGSSDWQLLLQVDTDDDVGMMWGDCGMLYFWIPRQALAEKDFSRVWMILQCG